MISGNIYIWNDQIMTGKKQYIKCGNLINQYKQVMELAKENMKEHNLIWPRIPDHGCSM